jgi:hypothetical protein
MECFVSPVYWKPKYATRSMRERAWARRSLAREEALKGAHGPSLLSRLRRLLGAR